MVLDRLTLTFFNNISEATSTNCNVVQFADDASILCRAQNVAQSQRKTDDELNKTDQTLKQHKVSLNEEKAEFLIFRIEKWTIVQNVKFKGHRLETSKNIDF